MLKGAGAEQARRSGGSSSSFLGKLLGKRSGNLREGGAAADGSRGAADLAKTCMYDGCKEGERVRDDWESGGGSSMYRGSADSESGRLERAERLLSRGHGKQGQLTKGVEED